MNELLNKFLLAETTEEEEQQLKELLAKNEPAGLEARLSRAIDGWNRVEKTTERRGRIVMARWISGIAASLLILFGLAFMAYRYTERETERALTAFSESINEGLRLIVNQ